MKRKSVFLVLLVGVVLYVFFGCSKETNPSDSWGTNTGEFAGRWFVKFGLQSTPTKYVYCIHDIDSVGSITEGYYRFTSPGTGPNAYSSGNYSGTCYQNNESNEEIKFEIIGITANGTSSGNGASGNWTSSGSTLGQNSGNWVAIRSQPITDIEGGWSGTVQYYSQPYGYTAIESQRSSDLSIIISPQDSLNAIVSLTAKVGTPYKNAESPRSMWVTMDTHIYGVIDSSKNISCTSYVSQTSGGLTSTFNGEFDGIFTSDSTAEGFIILNTLGGISRGTLWGTWNISKL